MAAEFTEIEIVPESPWRLSFRKMAGGYRDQLALERSRLVACHYDIDGKRFYPTEMTDNQLDWLSRRLAERDVSGAIRQNESSVKTVLSKRRRGQAV